MAIQTRSRSNTLALGIASLWLLAGCGGGGGDGAGAQADSGAGGGKSAAPGSDGSSGVTAPPQVPSAPGLPAEPGARPTLTIAAMPAAHVMVGAIYSLQPQVSHAEGELQFNIDNAPEWADFDVATGRLVGVPLSRHVGTTQDIVITVMEDGRQASLPPFAITVSPRPSVELPPEPEAPELVPGRVVLSWQIPTLTEHEALLADLEGYRVHHGVDAEALVHAIELVGSGTNQLIIDGLAAGRHYFAVRAVRAGGEVSVLSNIVSRQVK